MGGRGGRDPEREPGQRLRRRGAAERLRRHSRGQLTHRPPRYARLAALLALALPVGIVAAALGGQLRLATASAAPLCTVPQDPHPGWEAAFGLRPTNASALRLSSLARHYGFKGLVVEQDACTAFEVALQALPSRAVGLSLRSEARPVGFHVTLECDPVPDADRDFEGVFGTAATARQAANLSVRVSKKGFKGLRVEHDACTPGYEVSVPGLRSAAEGGPFKAEAKRAGFRVTIERS